MFSTTALSDVLLPARSVYKQNLSWCNISLLLHDSDTEHSLVSIILKLLAVKLIM